LTLCWSSFCHGRIHNIQSFSLPQCIIHKVLAAILNSSYTLSRISTLFIDNTYKYVYYNIL
jgi:hypothetical protein